MIDPDMGTWAYAYDNDGNLTSQTDNKGQTIKMYYDVLNRVTWKDVPPNGSSPGAEDMTFFYDGDSPP